MSTQEKPTKTKKSGRWRRRTLWALSCLIIAGFVMRAVLPLALPAVMRKIAGAFDLTCTYDRLELNLFSGDAGIWGLEFKPKEGGAPILYTDYCGGNVSVLNLFKAKLNVWRVEADGVDVNLDRNADGHIPLLDRFIAATATGKPASVAAAAPVATNSKPVDLASPLRIDALRLSHIRVHIHDRGVKPELDSELAMDLRLSDLGSTSAPAKFEMDFSADPFLDAMKITGEGRSGGKKLDASLHVSVRGVRLKTLVPYLAPLGIRPVADGITLTADGEVHTAPAPNKAEGFTGSIAFNNLSAKSDREEALALDHLAIDTGVIDTKSARINSFIVNGARATASRATDGNLQIAGIEYDPALVAHSPPVPASTSQPTSPLLLELMAERWSVGEISLKNARLDLHDQDIAPPVNLAFVVTNLSATSIDHDPKNLNTSVTLNGLLHAPGLISEVKLNGSATPFADQKHFAALLNATGIKPDAIKPYLDQIGVESTLKDAAFSAAVDASLTIADTLTANANVTQFDFTDNGPLLSLTSVSVKDATVNPKTGQIGVADIQLAGPGISILRNSAGQLSALGLRTKPFPPTMTQPAVVAAASNAPPSTSPPALVIPAINIGHFVWKGLQLNFEDQMQTPPTKLSVSDVGIEANDLSTNLAAKSPGHFKAWLVSPQIAKRLELNGSLRPGENELNLDATVNGLGLDTTPFAGYLKPIGIEPVLRDGGLTLHATANVTKAGTGIIASLGLDHLQFTESSEELAAVDDLQVKGVSLRDNLLGIDAIEITRPHAAARRDASGTLIAGGLRVLPSLRADPSGIPPTFAPPITAPTTQPAIPIVVTLKKLSVLDSNIDWSDAAVQPNVTTSAGASVELDNLTIGKDADPAFLNLKAHAAGSVGQLLVTGPVTAGPSFKGATLDVSATGLRVGPLTPYLPPGIGSSLKDGQFHTTVHTELLPNAAGGFGAQLVVGPLTFGDGADAASLFQLDSLRVIAPRIDLPENALAVDELSVVGVQTHAEKLPTGELACMGLLLGKKTATVATLTIVKTAPVVVTAPLPPPTTGPSVKDLLASAHKALPLITVEKMDLNVSKVTLTDLSRPASSPLVIIDLRLHNMNRIDWLGKDAAAKPATKLQFTCALLPFVDHVQADVSATPFARQPSLQLDFSATGVHGNGLTRFVPELKDQLDGTAMSNGSITAHFEADAKIDRQSPIDFDFSHGFDLGFVLNNVRYRAQPDGPVLAGVDQVQSEGIRIVPAESIVHVKTLEIDKPIGLITEDAKGIHALGWVYKLPTTKPAVPTMEPSVAAKTEAAPATVVKPDGEIRIDKLLISGLDFKVEDSSVDPPLEIPLNGLDVEVRNVSSLSPYEDKPIRFSAIVNADKVKLRKKGAINQELEDRDLFSQITANGEISLYPKLHGWAKTSVSGLDLASLEGPAKELGETLTAGLYDSDVDLRFDPTGAIAVTSKFTLTDLSLSEPPNGLIYRTLHLPAPLDVAIGAVEGADGSIALPINVNVNPTQISYSDLGLAAAGGISQVIVTALAAAPLKAVNDVGGLIGLSGPGKAPEVLATKIDFSPGSAAFGIDQSAAIAPLIQKLRDDLNLTVTVRQQLGNGDLRLAGVQANPTTDQDIHLMQQLRTRKQKLLTLRSDTAGKARAQLVTLGSAAAEPTLQQLRAIDRELADTEQSLDQIGELLRPGADRLADRRTRTAALQIGADRLAAVKSALLAAGIFGDRVKIVTAQFNPAIELDGGQIIISVVHKK